LPRLGCGEAHRAHLRIGEGDPGNGVPAGPVARVAAGDHVGRDPRLVFAHVGERCQAGAVADRIQPAAGNPGGAEPVVDLHRPPRLQPDAAQADVVCGGTAADGHQDLVRGHLLAAAERRADRPVGASAPDAGQPSAEPNRDALPIERGPHLVAGERLLAGEQSRTALDHGHLRRAEPAERLGQLYPDGPAAQHEQPRRHLLRGRGRPVVPGPHLRQARHRR
jgi:hypothetical protein